MILAGIDVGLSGAIALLDVQTGALRIEDMPTHENGSRREVSAAGLCSILSACRVGHAFVERVHSMPREGVTSAFRFGQSYGVVLGVLAGQGTPVTTVPPVTWKRAMQVPAEKKAARARASELLPSFAYLWPLVKHADRAEAAMIAEYGRRMLNATGAM